MIFKGSKNHFPMVHIRQKPVEIPFDPTIPSTEPPEIVAKRFRLQKSLLYPYCGIGKTCAIDVSVDSLRIIGVPCPYPDARNSVHRMLGNLHRRFRGIDAREECSISLLSSDSVYFWTVGAVQAEIGVVPKRDSISIFQDFLEIAQYLPSVVHCTIAFQESDDSLDSLYSGFSKIRLYFWMDISQIPDKTLLHEKIASIRAQLEEFVESLFRVSCLETLEGPPYVIGLEEYPQIYNDLIATLSVDRITPHLMVSQQAVNFEFPTNLKLQAALVLPNERYVSNRHQCGQQYIQFGNYLNFGSHTPLPAGMLVDDLTKMLLVLGKTGSGKSKFVEGILQEIQIKCPGVGCIYINTGKEEQFKESHALFDHYVEYGDGEFHLPYFIPSRSEARNRYFKHQLTSSDERQNYIYAEDLTAALGLCNPFDSIIFNVITEMLAEGGLPETIAEFLDAIRAYMENPKNSYAADLNQTLKTAFYNRAAHLRLPSFVDCTKLTNQLPNWFQWWLEGKSVFVDLSKVDDFIRGYLVFAILSLIGSHVQGSTDGRLKYVVVFDEAHRVFSRPSEYVSETDLANAAALLDKRISRALSEFRSRGISVIVSDQMPYKLLPCVVNEQQIKVMFNLNDSESPYYISKVEAEQELLCSIPERTALMFNGISGERYLFYSKDVVSKSSLDFKREGKITLEEFFSRLFTRVKAFLLNIPQEMEGDITPRVVFEQITRPLRQLYSQVEMAEDILPYFTKICEAHRVDELVWASYHYHDVLLCQKLARDAQVSIEDLHELLDLFETLSKVDGHSAGIEPSGDAISFSYLVWFWGDFVEGLNSWVAENEAERVLLKKRVNFHQGLANLLKRLP
jgi:hypothetical protein